MNLCRFGFFNSISWSRTEKREDVGVLSSSQNETIHNCQNLMSATACFSYLHNTKFTSVAFLRRNIKDNIKGKGEQYASR